MVLSTLKDHKKIIGLNPNSSKIHQVDLGVLQATATGRKANPEPVSKLPRQWDRTYFENVFRYWFFLMEI